MHGNSLECWNALGRPVVVVVTGIGDELRVLRHLFNAAHNKPSGSRTEFLTGKQSGYPTQSFDIAPLGKPQHIPTQVKSQAHNHLASRGHYRPCRFVSPLLRPPVMRIITQPLQKRQQSVTSLPVKWARGILPFYFTQLWWSRKVLSLRNVVKHSPRVQGRAQSHIAHIAHAALPHCALARSMVDSFEQHAKPTFKDSRNRAYHIALGERLT